MTKEKKKPPFKKQADPKTPPETEEQTPPEQDEPTSVPLDPSPSDVGAGHQVQPEAADTPPDEGQADENGEGAQPTFDDLLTNGYQAEFDQRLEQARQQWTQEQTPPEGMDETQLARYQLQQERAAFDRERAEFAAQQMQVSVASALQQRGIPADFAKWLAGKDAETSAANVTAFETAFNSLLETKLTERMRGGRLPTEQRHGSTLTPDDVRKMSPEEINANWNAVQKAMKR